MVRPQALATIVVLALLAAGLAYAVGVYGPILAGVAGLILVVGVSWKSPERQLLEQSPTAAALDLPESDSGPAEPDPAPGARPWLWKAVVVAFSIGLGVLGFALEATLFRFSP